MNEEKSITQNEAPKRRRPVKKILLGIFILSFVLFGAAGITVAQKVHHMKKEFGDKGPLFFLLEKVTKDLDLSADQKTKLEDLRKEIKTKMETKKDKRHEGMEELEKAFRQDKFDVAALDAMEQQREADRKEMRAFFKEELVKFHDILTPEQREKAADKMKEMREKIRNGNFKDFKEHHDFNRDDKDKNE